MRLYYVLPLPSNADPFQTLVAVVPVAVQFQTVVVSPCRDYSQVPQYSENGVGHCFPSSHVPTTDNMDTQHHQHNSSNKQYIVAIYMLILQ